LLLVALYCEVDLENRPKKKGLKDRVLTDLLGITSSAWSSAERVTSKICVSNLKTVDQNFNVIFSWLDNGEGSQSVSMAAELGDGKFAQILITSEMLDKKTTLAILKYMFKPTLQFEHALGYMTSSDLPPEMNSSTTKVVPANLESRFENGKE